MDKNCIISKYCYEYKSKENISKYDGLYKLYKFIYDQIHLAEHNKEPLTEDIIEAKFEIFSQKGSERYLEPFLETFENFSFNKNEEFYADKLLKYKESLKDLTLYNIDVTKITSFPQKIELLRLTNCKNIEKIFENSAIEIVIIDNIDFNKFDSDDIKISNKIKDITINNCKNVYKFINKLPKNINSLKITYCDLVNISEVPSYIGKLDIRSCKNPKYLMNKLKKIDNIYFNDLDLKGSFWNGENYPKLNLDDCKNNFWFSAGVSKKDDKTYDFTGSYCTGGKFESKNLDFVF